MAPAELSTICAVRAWESPKLGAAFPPWPELLINFGRVFWLCSLKRGVCSMEAEI